MLFLINDHAESHHLVIIVVLYSCHFFLLYGAQDLFIIAVYVRAVFCDAARFVPPMHQVGLGHALSLLWGHFKPTTFLAFDPHLDLMIRDIQLGRGDCRFIVVMNLVRRKIMDIIKAFLVTFTAK